MTRSRIENRELSSNIRINGRIYAAFRQYGAAEEYAYNLKTEYPNRTVEIVDQYEATILKLLPETNK